ncbi:MAG: hydroxyisourate hydrolase [Candidatus Eisenbacteria bacterium]|uniref:5-hydroxyisourate hydrolase n=1 Tax=Eiseniibacteriota bacterium TaxID=2212470 RepID=A0A849SL57_UNCEI|nr:hydroxyisourate hydrolase [Candidatus Eisenbacteria bacterium]
MSAITTHVLDLALGRPAAGLQVRLDKYRDGDWIEAARGATDADGRLKDLLTEGERPATGSWRITFVIGDYFRSFGMMSFYSEIPIVFEVRDADQHYHVPLLVSPFGYSTYRGS